jgi:Zn-dependent peptidase ImmA (M78 family)/transcriptional regulator with XRE-family HTH domain
MTDPAPQIGRRLRAARQRAHVSQAEIAARLEVTQTAVSYWEAGRRLPGIDDLMKIANILDVSLTDLLPGDSERRPLAAVLRAVADQVQDETLGQSLERFAKRAAQVPAPEAELAVRAAGARDAAEQLLVAAKPAKVPPVDVADIARRCGVRVLSFDFTGMVDGLVAQLPDGPAIGLDTNQANEQRRRFTLAHELGHHLLRHSSSFHVDFFDAGGSAGDSPGYNWQHERAANEFAANLLMPAELVRREADHVHGIDELAALFDVSRQAMAFRLAALGLRQGPLT